MDSCIAARGCIGSDLSPSPLTNGSCCPLQFEVLLATHPFHFQQRRNKAFELLAGLLITFKIPAPFFWASLLHPIDELCSPSTITVEREKKLLAEQRYEKSIEVDQKTKQIGLERNALDQTLTEILPAAWTNVKESLGEITVADCDAAILDDQSQVPEAIQVRELENAAHTTFPLVERGKEVSPLIPFASSPGYHGMCAGAPRRR